MTQVLWKGVATVTLLLASVTTASAESAWALWVWIYTIPGTATRLQEIDSIYTRRDECDAALVRRAHIMRADGYTPMITGTKPNRSLFGRRENQGWSYQCLPETIDPRGAKEK